MPIVKVTISRPDIEDLFKGFRGLYEDKGLMESWGHELDHLESWIESLDSYAEDLEIKCLGLNLMMAAAFAEIVHWRQTKHCPNCKSLNTFKTDLWRWFDMPFGQRRTEYKHVCDDCRGEFWL